MAKKERLYLNHLDEGLKNPSPNKYILIYTDDKSEAKLVKKSKERITLSQRMDRLETVVMNGFKRMDAKMDAGFKQVNTRLDYIVKANNLKDLPKSK